MKSDGGQCSGQGFRPVAFAWERLGHRQYRRYLLRRCQSCDTLDAIELHYLNPEYLWCYNCLSQAVVTISIVAGLKRWVCLDCQQISSVQVEAEV